VVVRAERPKRIPRLLDQPVGSPVLGLESKGLELPGRKSFDSNSQLPSGEHDGRPVYYAFARYPKTKDAEFLTSDLVIFHADVLNPPSDYIHRNKSLSVFGGYADVMIRDRKMYVLKTPYTLLEGLESAVTLIAPAGEQVADGLTVVGSIDRVEADEVTVAYRFDLRTNELTPELARNPSAGLRHTFTAYQRRPTGTPVELRASAPTTEELDAEAAQADC
jgi:hypothetical protein